MLPATAIHVLIATIKRIIFTISEKASTVVQMDGFSLNHSALISVNNRGTRHEIMATNSIPKVHHQAKKHRDDGADLRKALEHC